MKGGDLSNERARAIGMRFERTLKTQGGKLNRAAKAYLEATGRIEINRYIITTGSSRLAMAFCYKWAIPYFRVIEAESDFEIADICNENRFVYYFDADRSVVENVNIRSRGVKAEQWTLVEVS